MAIIRRIYSAKYTKNVAEIHDTGSIYCFNISEAVASVDIPDTCVFLVEDSNGDNVFGMDADGEVYVKEQVYENTSTPLVTGISPTYGTTAGGDTITIDGEFFNDETTVTINGDSCTSVTLVSSSQITADSPAESAGTYDLVVANPNQGSFELKNAFTYYGAPSVTACSPSSGNSGTALTITGSGFAAIGSSIPTVAINGITCTSIVYHSTTEIVCRAPANANGTYDVVVTNPDSQTGTLSSGFEYVTCPVVSSASPWWDLTGGGTSITISGSNFAAGATVTIGGTAATGVSVDDANTITCTAPAGTEGVRNIVVENSDGGIGTLYNGFEYFTQTLISLSDAAGADSTDFPMSSGRIVFFVDSLGGVKLVGQVFEDLS